MAEAERFSSGEFVIDVDRRTFFHGPAQIKLSGIPFDVLVLLVRTRGMLTKEQIFEEVWRNRPETTFDPNLVERAISSIRASVTECPEFLAYLRVERGRGVILDAPFERESLVRVPPAVSTPPPPEKQKSPGKTARVAVTSAAVLIVLLTIYWIAYRHPAPEFADAVPLTSSGNPKYAPLIILRSPHRILFTELVNGRYQISWIEPETRNSGKVLTDVADPTVLAVSRDEKTLLLRSVAGSFQDDGALFLQPIAGGIAVPTGVVGYDGQWAPDGSWIAITVNGAIARYDQANGTTRTLYKAQGYAWWPRFSPDGDRLRFTMLDGDPQVNSLWDLDLRTLRSKRISPEFGEWSTAAAGGWANSGTDYFFQTGQGNGPFSLWWMPGRGGVWSIFTSPRRLTTGPINFRAPQPDITSSTLFARGQIPRAEMIRISLSDNSTEMFLPDAFAAAASYSPDGAWVAYYSTNPEQALFKCTAGGADRQLLIPSPIQSSMPKWSPDGRYIAVSTRYPREP